MSNDAQLEAVLARGYQPAEFGKGDFFQRLADRLVDALPAATHAAVGLQVAPAVVRGAFGEGQRAFQRIQDGCSGDFAGWAG